MASVIKIKKSGNTAVPTSLASGELAYSWHADAGGKLYIGSGEETGGAAQNQHAVGGYYYTKYLDHTPGTLTANAAIIVNGDGKIDVLKVGSLYLTGTTIQPLLNTDDLNLSSNRDLVLDTTGASNNIYLSGHKWPNQLGSSGTFLKLNNDGVLSWNDPPIQTFNIFSNNNIEGTAVTFSLYKTLSILGNGPINTSVAVNGSTGDGTLNINVDLASSSTLGVAKFNSTDFSVDDNQGLNPGLVSLADQTGIVMEGQSTTATFGSSSLIPSITVNEKGIITSVSTNSIATSLIVYKDSNSNESLNLLQDTLKFISTNATTTVNKANNVVTINTTVPIASSSVLGVAKFDSTDFSINGEGAVSVNSITLGTSTLNPGVETTTLAGLQQLNVDSITIDSNGISYDVNSAQANGDIVLSPKGNGTVSVSGKRITALGTPTSDYDAATKLYVDNAIQGLTYKAAVNLLATTNISLAGLTETLIIDGHAALSSSSNGYRLLLTNQTDDTQNGIYVYNDIGEGTYTLTRSLDADSNDELIGTVVLVDEGTTYGSTTWIQANHYITNFTGQEWVKFTKTIEYSAGYGLALNGTTFNVITGDGIEIHNDTVQLDDTVAGNGLQWATIVEGSQENTRILQAKGTATRISVSSSGIDIDTNYAGQSTITTLGTINSGVWNGTYIGVVYGGTGLTSINRRSLLIAAHDVDNAYTTLAGSTSDGSVLRQDSTGAAYWSTTIDGGEF